MAKKTAEKKEASTEEKIKAAASRVFTSKGFAATRTRDIAEASGLNLALLNYYFRSKEKLFQIVMTEKIQKFLVSLMPVINDESSTLESKLESISSSYIDMLLANPDLPFFVLGEIRNNPDLIVNLGQKKDFLKNSVLIRQIREKKPDQDPFQFFLNILSLCIFPFISRPLFQRLTDTDDQKFRAMMTGRKKLIPVWLKAISKVK